MAINLKWNSDKIGITTSLACIIHCLLIPALFIFSGYSLNIHDFNILGINLDYIFVTLALIPALQSIFDTHLSILRISFICSWILFLIGILFHESIMQYSMHLGSIGLIITHYYKLRLCSTGKCEHNH
jgi:hypothetical protein